MDDATQVDPEVGEYVYLISHGGKFYQADGTSYCDTPLMSFVLEPPKGFRRIE